MSRELKSFNIGERGLLIDPDNINYAYAMSDLSKKDNRRISISIDQYNNRELPQMKDGNYIFEIDNMVIGVIKYRKGRPILDRFPKYLTRLEWLDSLTSSHKES